MRANQFHLERAAAALGISKGSLYLLIEKSPTLRTAKDVPQEELARVWSETGGDLDGMSEILEVSRGGLRLRVKELRIDENK